VSATVHFFREYKAQAEGLAARLSIGCERVSVRCFPDGESLVRVGETASTALVYCSLDRPDAKLVRLLLAASALRDGGANRVALIAPYLGYMRQDRAFHHGEAVSQRVIGGLIASAFDALVTVDPHLHRTFSLEAVVPGIAAVNVSAAATIAQAIAPRIVPGTILVGPDGESRPWVEAVAAPLGLDVMIGEKVRHGDRKVELAFSNISRVAGLPVMLVDDLISSGSTLIACADQLRMAGAAAVAAVATHCLASEADLAALAASGIAPVLATDTVPGPVAAISMATTLAGAIRQTALIP
jgi:ribose-phosphate pyrophosphokinase